MAASATEGGGLDHREATDLVLSSHISIQCFCKTRVTSILNHPAVCPQHPLSCSSAVFPPPAPFSSSPSWSVVKNRGKHLPVPPKTFPFSSKTEREGVDMDRKSQPNLGLVLSTSELKGHLCLICCLEQCLRCGRAAPICQVWMNEWVNACMNDWMHEWMDIWMNEWVNEWPMTPTQQPSPKELF